MKIRTAVAADIPALISLNRSVQNAHADAFPDRYRSNPPEEEMVRAFTGLLDASLSYWLIAEEAQPVAYLRAEFRDRIATWCVLPHRTCYLADLAVDLSHRRRGIARALLAELQREANTRGVTSIELDVWSFNEQAASVFAQLGFKDIMRRMVLARSSSEGI